MNDYENISNLELNSYKSVGSLTEDNLVATGDLSNAISAICYNLSNMLDKREGGSISGDVEVVGHELRILSGNYFQSNTTSNGVQNFSRKNSFLQAESVFEVEGKHEDWGIACTGTKGYYILYVDLPNNRVKLSSQYQNAWMDFDEHISTNPDATYSIALGSGYAVCCMTLANAVSNDISSFYVSIKDMNLDRLAKLSSTKSYSEEKNISYISSDDNGFYCPEHPEFGENVLNGFYANHAEGGSVKAIGKYTHAEGRHTLADCRYSHAEGDQTKAYGYATHTEGSYGIAYGHSSHAEGYSSNAIGDYAHAEGLSTFAYGKESHAEGGATSTLTTYSHAEGFHSTAAGIASHAEGQYTTVSGEEIIKGYAILSDCIDESTNQLCIQIKTIGYAINDILTIVTNENIYLNCSNLLSCWIVSGSGSSTIWALSVDNLPAIGSISDGYVCCIDKRSTGNKTVLTVGSQHAEGFHSTATGIASHAEGFMTVASGEGSHAEGYQTSALTPYAHAEGYCTAAFGKGAHAEGISNYAIADGSTASSNTAGSTRVNGDGENYAGTFAFNVISADSALSTLKLNSLTSEHGNLSDLNSNEWIVLYKRGKNENDPIATYDTKFYGIVGDSQNNTISVSYIPSNPSNNINNGYVYFPNHPLYGTTRIGDGSLAHGFQCHAMEDAAAIGCQNQAFGRYSITLGVGNKANYLGIAIGTGNSAYGQHSIAMGGGTGGANSSFDKNTKVYSNNAFGWTGISGYIISGASRNGTFNIDPISGLSGFYIGNKNLASYLNEICSTTSNQYLKKDEFSTLSNTIGLSAASASNQVVTKKDIADLAGAMHFRGAVSDPSEIITPVAGDVIIIPSTSKEYVYNGTEWIELGDEALYATKAEVSTISAELTSDIAGLTADVDYLSGQIDATNATLNTVSSDYLTSTDKTELETLVGTTSAETLVSANAYTDEKISALSNSNVYISSISSDEAGNVGLDVAEKLDKFTIYKFDSLSAYNLSGSSFGILSSDIVLIDENQLNAEMNTIISVADPVDATDAANKQYVDSNVRIRSQISASAAINAFIDQVNLGDGLDEVEIKTAISALLDLVNILSGSNN